MSANGFGDFRDLQGDFDGREQWHWQENRAIES